MILTEKYRPRRFSEFYGNKEQISKLKKVLASKDKPHVYLISGPFGIGKTSLARIMAMALNCSKFDGNNDVCCECDGCQAVLNQGIDICEVDGATYRGIQDAKRIREIAYLKPWRVRNRVIILDEVHQITDEASSSLLKCLETEIETTYFILVTTEKHKVKATIRSRAYHVDLKFPTSFVIRQFIQDICMRENIEVPEIKDDEFISFRDAIFMLEGGRSVEGLRSSVKLLWKLMLNNDFEGVKKESIKLLQSGFHARTIFLDLVDYLISMEISEKNFLNTDLWRTILDLSSNDFIFEHGDLNTEFKSLSRALGFLMIFVRNCLNKMEGKNDRDF